MGRNPDCLKYEACLAIAARDWRAVMHCETCAVMELPGEATGFEDREMERINRMEGLTINRLEQKETVMDEKKDRDQKSEVGRQKKTCSKCGKEKDLEKEFGKRSTSPDGHTSLCRGCKREYEVEWRRQKGVKEAPGKKKKDGGQRSEARGRKPPGFAITAEKINKTSPINRQQSIVKVDEVVGSALEVQVGGDYYKNFVIQPVAFITRNNLSFLQGCVVKRISRYNRPGGQGLQDLRKIQHEVDLLIELAGL